MTRGNDPAQSMSSTDPRCGWPAICWRISKNHFVYVSRRGGAQGIQCLNAMQGGNLAARPDKWASRGQSLARAPPYSSYKYHAAPPGGKCEESEV
jgi:hypothetical protein